MHEGDMHTLISIFHFIFRDQFLFSIIWCSCYVIDLYFCFGWQYFFEADFNHISLWNKCFTFIRIRIYFLLLLLCSFFPPFQNTKIECSFLHVFVKCLFLIHITRIYTVLDKKKKGVKFCIGLKVTLQHYYMNYSIEKEIVGIP